MSMIALAGSRVTDVKQYLKEVSSDRSIKYSAEKGAKHHLFIPTKPEHVTLEDGSVVTVETINAISQRIHDWTDSNGNYNTTICLDGIVRNENGVLLNDGTCPICQRVSDAWEIYNKRKEELEASCTLPAGKAREDFIKKTLEGYRDDMKAKDARDYVYLLVAVFETKDGQPVIDEETKLPRYAMKVMKLSSSRLDKINKQLNNSGCEFGGSEIIIEYKNTEDIKQQVGESTVSLVMESQMFTRVYPQLFENIKKEAMEFEFDSIDKAFKEWKGMSVEEAKIKMNSQFKRWDEYKEALKTNPGAMYLEYSQASANVPLSDTPAPQVMPANNLIGSMGQMPPQGAPVMAPTPQVLPNGVDPMGVAGMGAGVFPQGVPVGQVNNPTQAPVAPQANTAPQGAPVAAPMDSAVAGMGAIPDPNVAFSASQMHI